MSELILHAAHLSEAHQLRFSYLFEVAAKHWRDKQPSQTAKAATELWVIDAHSAPDAIQNRSNSSFVLLIATDDQTQAARAQWPDQIDAQLPPDYSVGRLTQMLEHISVQAHGKRLRETLKTRRQHSMTLGHDVQIKTADAAFLRATDLNLPTVVVAEPLAEPVVEAATATATATPAALGNLPAAGTRFRIKRWTQLTGSMAGQAHRQLLAAMISGDRSIDELSERAQLEPSEILRVLQVLRAKGVLVETAAPAAPESTTLLTPASPASAAAEPGPAAAKLGLFRQLSRWINQNRASDPH
ncbi:hypothetical protein HS961_19975 [Comamonas piscis]|uniref:Uncharacterized protein n=1 Tax=Comamonas piscis TaxID=1562974 RepID=A0A7G5ELQ7_9BURK|nr:hypothetical protein [Comamonas piscis]QMV74932.1 hypothetical protein HS961_19975 [Comamonas piscis]WSO33409.1 hypothetical protein VUJ63_20040 [Comamonas piscis]